jgi:hypothetical protein
MHTYTIHATLLALWYFNVFRPLKGHLQRKKLIHFHSQINTKCSRCKILKVKAYVQVKLQYALKGKRHKIIKSL